MRMHADKKSANGPIALISRLSIAARTAIPDFARRVMIRKISPFVHYLLFSRLSCIANIYRIYTMDYIKPLY